MFEKHEDALFRGHQRLCNVTTRHGHRLFKSDVLDRDACRTRMTAAAVAPSKFSGVKVFTGTNIDTNASWCFHMQKNDLSPLDES